MLSASQPNSKDFHVLLTHLLDASNNVSDEHLDLWLPSVPWLLKLMQPLPQWKCHSAQSGTMFTGHSNSYLYHNKLPFMPFRAKILFHLNKRFQMAVTDGKGCTLPRMPPEGSGFLSFHMSIRPRPSQTSLGSTRKWPLSRLLILTSILSP